MTGWKERGLSCPLQDSGSTSATSVPGEKALPLSPQLWRVLWPHPESPAGAGSLHMYPLSMVSLGLGHSPYPPLSIPQGCRAPPSSDHFSARSGSRGSQALCTSELRAGRTTHPGLWPPVTDRSGAHSRGPPGRPEAQNSPSGDAAVLLGAQAGPRLGEAALSQPGGFSPKTLWGQFWLRSASPYNKANTFVRTTG